jgi:CubicO group peptidase (beta-lactamase class C family)
MPMSQKLLLVCAFLFGCSSAVFAAPDANALLSFTRPEAVGMSSARLARIGTVIKADIAAGRIPGAVVAIARHGKLVAFDAYGWRDKAAGLPMTTDTIFNIASMTKPMTAVGALMLYEQGRILMDDPLSKYFPKFVNSRVAGRDARGEPTLQTVPANRAIIIQDLLTHTSGLIYGSRGNTVIHKMYPSGTDNAPNGPAFVDKLATLPLLWQPGSTWDYGFGLDITGQIIEKLSGQTLVDRV